MAASDWRAHAIRDLGVTRHQLELSELFVGHVFTLLESDRRNAAPLRRGISRLAVMLNSVVPDLNEGKEVGGVTPHDLAETMAPLDHDTILTFIECAGTVMLESHDGPMGSSVSLKRVIDEVEEKLEGSK